MRRTKYGEPLAHAFTVRLSESEAQKAQSDAAFIGIRVSEYLRRLLRRAKVPVPNMGLLTALNDLRVLVAKHGGLFKHLYSTNPVYSKETAAALQEQIKLYSMIVADYEALRKSINEEIAPNDLQDH